MKKYLSILFLSSILSTALLARDVIDDSGSCKVNWTQGDITCEAESATGQSSFAAKISSKIIAQRNMLEVIKGVRIDSEVTVQDGFKSSEIIKSRVEGFIRGSQVLSNKYDEKTGAATAQIRIEMGPDLLSALLSDPTQLTWNERVIQLWDRFSIVAQANAMESYDSKERETVLKLLNDMREAGNKPAETYLNNVLTTLKKQKNYTGILIDVRNASKFQKALIVKLVDSKGNELYPSKLVSKELLTKRNTSMGFMLGLDDARHDKRIFHIPLEISAKDVYYNRRSDIMLNDAQIEQINRLNPEILQNAKIVLVLGD